MSCVINPFIYAVMISLGADVAHWHVNDILMRPDNLVCSLAQQNIYWHSVAPASYNKILWVPKPPDLYWDFSNRFEIWHASRQHRCRAACQIQSNAKFQNPMMRLLDSGGSYDKMSYTLVNKWSSIFYEIEMIKYPLSFQCVYSEPEFDVNVPADFMGPLLLTGINFNLNMDK